MPILSQLIEYIASRLTALTGQAVKVININTISGGSINQAYRLQTTAGHFMLKLNSRMAYPDMFTREAEGLKAIAGRGAIAVPNVILQDDFEDQSFLLMAWIDTRRPTDKAFQQLGRQLAALHQNTAVSFGFEYDNYIGSLAQSNRSHHTWSDFLIIERLQPMLKLAVDNRLVNSLDVQHFEDLCRSLPELFEEEQPSLLHGDLWGGNYLIDTNEKPYLIDPAVYYGHREMDIAMTTLFGGFGDSFYHAYLETCPLKPGWRERLDLWNLYPLLVHVNLFGGNYVGQVRAALKKFV